MYKVNKKNTKNDKKIQHYIYTHIHMQVHTWSLLLLSFNWYNQMLSGWFCHKQYFWYNQLIFETLWSNFTKYFYYAYFSYRKCLYVLCTIWILMETERSFLLGYFKPQQDYLCASQLNLFKNQSVISTVLPSSVLMRCHTMSQRIYILPRLAWTFRGI